MVIASIITLLATVLFIGLWFVERRTLWIGILALIWIGITIPYIIVSAETMNVGYALTLALILIGILIIGFPFYLMSFILLLLTSGIRLIKREGKRFRNLLSVLLGVFLIAWLIFSPFLVTNIQHWLLMIIVNCITITVYYFFIMMLIFAVSSMLNRLPVPFKKYDYIIVLGSGLIGDQVPPLLASRIKKGIECFKRYHTENHPVKVVFTGGQGQDEKVAEGIAMATYAKAQGLAEQHIIIEDRAVNTYENMLFSKQLIEKDRQQLGQTDTYHILTVTNNFHVFRALLWARKVGIKSDGVGSETKFYFWLNALIREFIGVMYMQKKTHIAVLIIGYTLAILSVFIQKYFVLPYID